METFGLSLRDMEIAEDIVTMKATGMTFIDIANKHGITDRRLRDIRRTSEFKEYYRERTLEVFGERAGNVLSTIVDRAEKGDMKAAKLFVDITGYRAASKVEVKSEVVGSKHISSEELALDLAEMKGLIDEVKSMH